jgi:hypothetical protein
MAILGRMIWAGQVWLTALLALAANFPHFECRCPNGQVKPYCLGFCGKSSGCCCFRCGCGSAGRQGPRCCQARRAESHGNARRACCHGRHQSRPASELPSERSSVAERTVCVKTLAGVSAFVRAAVPTGGPGLIPAVPLCPHGFRAGVSLPATHGPFRWQIHSPAPPADLVTVLQRLLL